MIKLRRAVIVEGKYDKIKLSSLLDTVIITTALSRRLKNILLRSVVLMKIFSGKRIS